MTATSSHPPLSELIEYWLNELAQPAAEADPAGG